MAEVVDDAGHLASNLRLARSGLGEVVDGEVAVGRRSRALTACVGDVRDVELGPAGVVAGLDRGQREGDGVAVLVGNEGGEAVGVEEEGAAVGPGNSPELGVGGVGADRSQVEMNAGRLLPEGNTVR